MPLKGWVTSSLSNDATLDSYISFPQMINKMMKGRFEERNMTLIKRTPLLDFSIHYFILRQQELLQLQSFLIKLQYFINFFQKLEQIYCLNTDNVF